MSMELRLDSRALQVAERRLAFMPKAMEKAGRDAVKRTLSKAQTAEIRAINARVTLKMADIRYRMHISQKNPYAGMVTAEGKKLPLNLYQHRPRSEFSELRCKPRGGIRMSIKRGGGNEVWEGTFVERGRNSRKLYILARAMEGGKRVGRYPLYIQYGPPLARAAEEVLLRITPDLRRFLHKRFMRNVRNVRHFNPSR